MRLHLQGVSVSIFWTNGTGGEKDAPARHGVLLLDRRVGNGARKGMMHANQTQEDQPAVSMSRQLTRNEGVGSVLRFKTVF